MLLTLLNGFGKRDKVRDLSSILSPFRKSNNTGARMLNSIYHMTLKLLKNACLAGKSQDFATLYATL